MREYVIPLPKLRTIVIHYQQVVANKLPIRLRLVLQEVIYVCHSLVWKGNPLVSRTKVYNTNGLNFAVRLNLLPVRVNVRLIFRER